MAQSYDHSPPELLNPLPPTRSDIYAFLSRHLHLLASERQAEIDQTSLLASNCSPRLLEKRGLAIGSLGVASVSVGLGGKTTGDPARLEANPANSSASTKKKGKSSGDSKPSDKNGDDEGMEGVISKVTSDRITLTVDSGKDLEIPERLRLLKLANSGTFDRMEATLRHVARIMLAPPGQQNEETESKCTPRQHNADLLDVLFGLRSPSRIDTAMLNKETSPDLSSAGPDAQGMQWFDTTLNDSQRRAVEFSLCANEVACIHGPPGTGKTFTLIEIIRQLVLVQKKKVLICGASNLAVGMYHFSNNLLARLAPLLPPSAVVRLGHPARITQSLLIRTLDYRAANSDDAEIAKDVKYELEGSMQQLSRKKGEKGWVKGRERAKKWDDVRELRKEYRTREAKVVKNVMAGAQVVLSTCHGAGSRQVNNMNFDVCIIDEATQAMEAVCWIPILKSKKLILAGDPLQLPPTILSANQKAAPTKVKIKPLNFPELVACEKAKPVGVDSTGACPEPTVQPADAVPSTVEVASQATDETSVASLIQGTENLPVNDDNDTEKPEQAATADKDPKEDAPSSDSMEQSNTPSDEDDEEKPEEARIAEDVEAPKEQATPSNGMKKSKTTSKRPKLSPPRTLEMTLFDRLEKMYGAGIKRLLAVQYRMHASIAEFPSEALYSSALISHESVASRRLIDLPFINDKESEDAQDVLSPTLVFFDTSGTEMYERLEGDDGDSSVNKSTVGEGSRYNENEAEIVSKWVRQLISFGIPQTDIAIITPYQAQVAHLSSLLRNDFPELVCGSVDGMQGQEREAVVLSLVRSNPEREVGFLAEYRRLNVAMTRAKRQLCVVGDSGTVGKGSGYLKKWMDFLEEHADVRWAGDHV
ncbi:hypothetical protein QFC22_005501 [Naganishia vaughanmartiniae]|uniref:Uncharacterized protein n=1 Tax=Naganishia vaughanmartiniae TaxID=1424756 RepID=A0ACC2WT13_9TREE|nr:hypothetical protein QFC22_005501 [Naganishia vaughanmartiniae]